MKIQSPSPYIFIWKMEEDLPLIIQQARTDLIDGFDALSPKRQREKAFVNLLLQQQLPGARIGYNDNGRPFIIGRPDLGISISHSGNYACLMLCEGKTDIGVDIEVNRPEKALRVRPKFMTDEEIALHPTPCEGTDALLAWTTKEALFKLATPPHYDFISGFRILSYDMQGDQGSSRVQDLLNPDVVFEVKHWITEEFVMTWHGEGEQNTWLLNFEHDLALASGKPFYIPPKVAVAMNEDLSPLPLWISPNANVLTKSTTAGALSQETLGVMRQLGIAPQLTPIEAYEATGGEQFNVWGWDPQSAQQLTRFGHETDPEQLAFIKEWSHRGKTVEFLQRFAEAGLFPAHMLPRIARKQKEVEQWTTERQLVLKVPLSGSGRGIWWAFNGFDFNVQRWSNRTLQTQGAILCEPIWQKTTDFAMEFQCENGRATFAGFSLFLADGAGVYRCNLLRSDDEIFKTLADKVGAETLDRIKQLWILLLEETIATRYNGIVGIDMLTGIVDGRETVDPCVEVNLRMTMGMTARLFFDRHVCPSSQGEFRTIHFKNEGELQAHAQTMSEKHPPVFENGKLKEGYVLLTCAREGTKYGVEVEIMKME